MKKPNWQKHRPGPCPVDRDTPVKVIMEDGTKIGPYPAREFDWFFPNDEIVKYKIVLNS